MSDERRHPRDGSRPDRARAPAPDASGREGAPGVTAQQLFKAQNRRRLVWASVAAVCGLVALILLGPSQQEVQRKFEVGAHGVLRIMPELSIEEGVDRTNQLPESIRNTPPPPEIEVEPEDLDDRAEEPAPQPQESEHDVAEALDVVSEDPDLMDMELVEMISPRQTSPCVNVIRQVKPQYPSRVTEAERRVPVVDVVVSFYVSLDGEVTASMISSNSGGPAFADVVLRAVEQWRFAPIDIECLRSNGLWLKWPIRFHSPYRSVRRSAADRAGGSEQGRGAPVTR